MNNIEKFLKVLHKNLEKDNWGTIDPDWFKPDYGDDFDLTAEELEAELADECSDLSSSLALQAYVRIALIEVFGEQVVNAVD